MADNTPKEHNRQEKKLKRSRNTGAKPTVYLSVCKIHTGRKWLADSGRQNCSVSRKEYFPTSRPACGFKQDFRHSSSQSPAPCCIPPGPSTQHGQQLLSRDCNEGGHQCRKASRRLLCLKMAMEQEANKRGTSLWWEQEGASTAWWAGKRESPLPLGGYSQRLTHQQACF